MDLSYRVVAVVAGNSEAVTLYNLNPDTQYQLTVAAVWGNKKFRSSPIVFRTLGNNLITNYIWIELNNIFFFIFPEPSHITPQQTIAAGNGLKSSVEDSPLGYSDDLSNLADINNNNSTTRELPTVGCKFFNL